MMAQTATLGAKRLSSGHVEALVEHLYFGLKPTSVRFGQFGARAFTWNLLYNMQHYLTFFQDKLKSWKDNRFLKKHGCETWEQYNRRYDPDYNIRASRVADYYHGYKNWMVIENHNHLVYYWDVHTDGIYVLTNWCKENFQGKFRFDFLRVYKQTPIGLNGPEDAEWWINDIGGDGDYIFFACQDERDFLLFAMRWA